MKVLVTGAAGFIGSHMVDRLLRDGHRVIGVDRFRWGIKEHLKATKKYKENLTLIQADISHSSSFLEKYFEGVEWVFHLAAKLGNAVSKLNPSEYHKTNVSGTVNILHASFRSSVKRFIYASTASIYGIPDSYPTKETAQVRLDYPYPVTKYIGEQYCLHFWKVYKLPILILRLFNVYGPKNRVHGACGPILSIFLEQKRLGQRLTIRGDGTQKRDFTYIDDICDIFILAAKSSLCGKIFNVGNGEAYSMNELAGLIGGPVCYVPFTEKEPSLTLASNSKIVKYLGWKPKVSLPLGIKRVLSNL